MTRVRKTLTAAFVIALAVFVGAQQNPSLHVIVIDRTGAAVPAAEVRILELPSIVGLPAPNGTFSFNGIPTGTYRVSAKYRGFKDKVVEGVTVAEGKTTEIIVKMEQGPPKGSDFGLHQELANTSAYSKVLADVGQPALCAGSVDGEERYRFLWVPTFFQPIFLRVEIEPDGTSTLLTYAWKGAGGYEWGQPVRSFRKLTFVEQSDLFAALADIGFWTLPAEVDDPPNVIVLDGTDWFIEGIKDGRCHVVRRYSSPLSQVFSSEFLENIAKVKPYTSAK